MHRMTASQECDGFSRCFHVHKTNWAVVICPFILALMFIFHIQAQTTTTVVAMIKVFLATNSANSTFFTVVYLFYITKIIVEIANFTKIYCKFFVALCTDSTFRLFLSTAKAFYMSDFFSIKLMILFRIHFLFITNLIMT